MDYKLQKLSFSKLQISFFYFYTLKTLLSRKVKRKVKTESQKVKVNEHNKMEQLHTMCEKLINFRTFQEVEFVAYKHQ